MQKFLGLALAAAVLSSGASANSITTLFNRNNGGSNGGAVYFDAVTNASALSVTGLDTGTNDTGIFFTYTVYARAGTSVGFENTNVGWSVVATGSGTGAGINVPTPVTLDAPFLLAANSTTGLALVIGATAGHDYSGTGTSPAPGALQYSNADITLNLGAAGNVPFSGTPFRPRIWNGTLHYTVVPEPATMAALAMGALVLIRRRRK
ncbi:MAG: PEP-CTERM sorting domain-containing protein [Fimbriimonadaceae bacterium]|nr:PEP-CTERM sorting domain-containing protein [Fimbriimonadaceae bacterium]